MNDKGWWSQPGSGKEEAVYMDNGFELGCEGVKSSQSTQGKFIAGWVSRRLKTANE